MFKVYTDGSSLIDSNGIRHGGVGIYFGENDSRNTPIPIIGSCQTNQYAELLAIYYALKFTRDIPNLEIYTDSQFAINCLTKWYVQWQNNGWKTSKKENVIHADIIKQCITIIEDKKKLNHDISISYVPGHKGDPGNEAADKLAKIASHNSLYGLI